MKLRFVRLVRRNEKHGRTFVGGAVRPMSLVIVPKIVPTIATIIIVAASFWCASGLVATMFASLVPTSLSPFLLTIKPSVVTPCMAVLLTAAPASHLTGFSMHQRNMYKIWQPFQGGELFVLFQACGWSFYSLGVLLLLVNGIVKLSTPGYMLGVVFLVVFGNAALLASLYLWTGSSPHNMCGWSPRAVAVHALGTILASAAPSLPPRCCRNLAQPRLANLFSNAELVDVLRLCALVAAALRWHLSARCRSWLPYMNRPAKTVRVALSEAVTDTGTCATREASGTRGALGSELTESDERFEWCGNHVYEAHSGKPCSTNSPDHLTLRRGDRVMEIMKFKARAQLRDLTCTVTTYKKTWGAYVPVHTRRTELGTFEEQAADEPPYEFHMPPDDVPNSFVVCGEYKVSIAFDSASTGQKPLLVRHAWSKIS